MAKSVSKGDTVTWKWGNGQATGTVSSVSTRKVTRTIAGKEVTRNGSKEDPAVYISRKEGNSVLKLASELE
jgi:Hypervirulence associated proteins TUDOR domain